MDFMKKKFGLFAAAVAVLCIPMLILFRQSFEPNLVLFSNDGPLGMIIAQYNHRLEAFLGYWEPLNWIGIQLPTALPQITSAFFYLSSSPMFFAKFYAPFAMIFLGLGAFTCMRQFGFRTAACLIAALAMELHSNSFSHACWGLPSRSLTLGAAFFAVAALQSGTIRKPWLKAILAGWAVAIGIMEGFDVGAIFSLYVAAFGFFIWAVKPGGVSARCSKAVGIVAVVAIFAAIFAAQALNTLINTQVKGVVGMSQDEKTKEDRWTEATMWSLPKLESLRLLIPGLFGYRMDAGGGGNYWGSVGQFPGSPATRHSGAGEYAGVMVMLVAAWAVAQSLSKKSSVYTDFEKKLIWFWGIAAFISLLLAWGRHAPFYKLVYALPYFSTIRNPMKFMHPFQLATGIIFACGVEGIARLYLENVRGANASFGDAWKNWWRNKRAFDRNWAYGSLAFLAAAVMGWLIYLSSGRELQSYLATAGFPGETGASIARFSQGEVAMFVVYLAVAVLALMAIATGWFAGAKQKYAFILIGGLAALDLMHANLPWVVYYDYKDKYATNPVLDFLRNEPFNHRVATQLAPFSRRYLAADQITFCPALMNEWLQQHFQYYRIQSPDIIQFPREPVLDDQYQKALTNPGRFWMMSNTRYILGQNEFLGILNQQLDPARQRFQILTNFEVKAKPNRENKSAMQIEDLTAELNPQGHFAIFEYKGALPRAMLFNTWQVETNDAAILTSLQNTNFNGTETVIISEQIPAAAPATNNQPGTVSITRYEPRHVYLSAQAPVPSILLLNDRWDPSWKVTVDGKPAELLRANFIMRGVKLEPGQHAVEFHFRPVITGLWVSGVSILGGLMLAGYLFFTGRDPEEGARPKHSAKKP
jgi:hypothetical protein